ncbi:MAG: hypothetical protein ACR2L1_07315 [Pyrinomonadaceae bacterium]
MTTHYKDKKRQSDPAKPLKNSYRLLGINNAGKPYFFWSEKPAQYAAYLGPSEPFGVWGSISKEICKNNMKDYHNTFIADYETALELEKLGAVKPCGKCNRQEKNRCDANLNLQVNRKVEIE